MCIVLRAEFMYFNIYSCQQGSIFLHPGKEPHQPLIAPGNATRLPQTILNLLRKDVLCVPGTLSSELMLFISGILSSEDLLD